MSSGKLLLGVFAGVAVGALLGILFAPEKGEVTRKKIAKSSEDYADSLKDKFNEFVDNLFKKFETVTDVVEDGKPVSEEDK